MPATARPPQPKVRLSYPRPPLVHDHTTLFQEPAYNNGEPYSAEPDDDDPET